MSVQATPTAALSVVTSHSPPHREDGGSGSDGVSTNVLSVGVGVAGVLLVLITAPLIIITVLVCLKRRNNKLNTTNNVAYVSTLLASLNTNEVYNDLTSSSEVPTSTNQAYLEVGKNGPTSNTDIVMATNPAYLEDGPIYEDADIPTSTNQAYLKKESSQGGSDTYTYDYIDT